MAGEDDYMDDGPLQQLPPIQQLPPFKPGEYYGGQMDGPLTDPMPPFKGGQFEGLDRPLGPPPPIDPNGEMADMPPGAMEQGPGLSREAFDRLVQEMLRRGRPEPVYDDQPIDKEEVPLDTVDPRMLEHNPKGPASGIVVDPMELIQRYFQQREQPDAAQAMVNGILNQRA